MTGLDSLALPKLCLLDFRKPNDLVSNGPLLARVDRDDRKIGLRVRFGWSAGGESRCSSRWSPLPLWCL